MAEGYHKKGPLLTQVKANFHSLPWEWKASLNPFWFLVNIFLDNMIIYGVICSRNPNSFEFTFKCHFRCL